MTDTQTKQSEPAFPIFPDTGGGHASAFRGMTLRDYFAAKAMQAEYHLLERRDQFKACAEGAYAMADAMLEARK